MTMALDKLGQSLSNVVKKITLAGIVDKRLVREVVKDIQRALLTADVNVTLVMELSKRIEERSLKEKPKPGMSKREVVIRVVYEELVALLGAKKEFEVPTKTRIMLVGIQGSGKTTTAVKLARFYAKHGLRSFLIAADTHRPAAYEQMVQLAEPHNIKVHGEPGEKDARKVLSNGLKAHGKEEVTILDTAGRHKSEGELFKEMKGLASVYKPDKTYLVIDGNIGQQAGAQAKAFNDAIGLTGVILTKLDGAAKGGGALSAVAETGARIEFIGVGEKLENLEVFDPDRFISRLLGMGDLASLMEKAKETVDEDRMKDILKGDFTLEDLYEQIKAISGMGPLSSLMKMIPGMGFAVPQEATDMTEEKMKRFLIMMDSMSGKEKREPKIINSSRVHRIARGSGTRPEEVKELLNYHKTMKKAIKGLKRGRFKRGPLAKMMRGMK